MFNVGNYPYSLEVPKVTIYTEKAVKEILMVIAVTTAVASVIFGFKGFCFATIVHVVTGVFPLLASKGRLPPPILYHPQGSCPDCSD